MRTILAGLVVVAVLLTSCGITAAADKHNDDGAFDGLWLLTEAEVDGRPVPIDERLFLEVDGNRATGDSTCNPVGGVFGDRPGASQSKLCASEPQGRFDPMAVEYAMRDAILSGPELIDGDLVFAKGGHRFVYEPVADSAPADLFAVIDDDTRIADPDEIVLDAEGGSPPPFQRLVRLDHPGTETVFYLGVDGDLLCLVHSSGDTGGYYCRPPRDLTHSGQSIVLDHRLGPAGPRAAFIPDQVVAAVADRPDLGALEGNILLITRGAAGRDHILIADNGDVFTLNTGGL